MNMHIYKRSPKISLEDKNANLLLWERSADWRRAYINSQDKAATISKISISLCEVACLVTSIVSTYLIGHNNPINGFRPAAIHPSRRLCFLRAYSSRSHQSMAGLPRFVPSNGHKVVLFADFRRSPHQIPVSLEYAPPYVRHGRASAAAEY